MHIQVLPIATFFTSSRFWWSNILAWLTFNLAQSVIDAINTATVMTNFLHLLPQAILGMLFSFGGHLLYLKMRWHIRHPLSLVWLTCILALAYGGINSLFFEFELLVRLPEICTRQTQGGADFLCGRLSNCFTHSAFYMLIWGLLYILIQAERKSPPVIALHRADPITAFTSLAAFIFFNQILSIVGWSSDSTYLFSHTHLVGEAIELSTACIISTIILFIKPGSSFLRSRLLPLLPTFFVLIFCGAVLSIGMGASLSRLIYLQAPDTAPLGGIIYYLLFGSNYGNWNSKGMFAGQLQGSIYLILLISLFYMGCRFSIDWRPTPSHTTKSLDIKKSLIVWSYTFGFWLFFAVLLYTSDIMELASFGASVPLVSTVSFVFFGTFMGMAMRTQIAYFSAKKMTSITLSIRIFITALVMGLLITCTLWLINFSYIFIVLDEHNMQSYTQFVAAGNYVFASILASCILCGLWAFICVMNESQQAQRDATTKRLLLEMNMKEVQLNALAGKIDPHFIFNALNNIRTLVDEDSEKARSALVSLSDILRTPIANNAQDKITLEQEMFLVRSYISLSKIQHEDNLTYQEEVSDDVATALIPAMMLQILTENAIKHGISQLPDGGILSLHIFKENEQLICQISNSGCLHAQSNAQGFGVGITTIQERLRLLYNDQASFSLNEKSGMVFANLVLPFESSI